MPLSDDILQLLRQNPKKKARWIANKLGCTKKEVNSALYGVLREQCQQDTQYEWTCNNENQQVNNNANNHNRENTREFALPNANQYSEEQLDIINLPPAGKHFITGGPGTGKSVVALSWARLLAEKGFDYHFLVYNNMLERASQQLYPDINSTTWIAWFNRLFLNTFDKRRWYSDDEDNRWMNDNNHPLNSFEFTNANWTWVINKILNYEEQKPLTKTYLIIDEGQDMPPQFYFAIRGLGAEHIFVVADQNQAIHPERNATLNDIQVALGINQRHKLTQNYRQKDNGYFVAQLAKEFACDRAAVPVELLINNEVTTDIPKLYSYNDEGLERICNGIVNRCEDESKLVGVIVFNNQARQRYINILGQIVGDSELDVNISTYHAGMELDDICFNQGGIMVINAQSCKGLEFDTVVIADINNAFDNDASDTTKKYFYVIVSRAREILFMLKDGARNCPVDEGENRILPQDEKILERHDA